jgi:hypothetical protein
MRRERVKDGGGGETGQRTSFGGPNNQDAIKSGKPTAAGVSGPVHSGGGERIEMM